MSFLPSFSSIASFLGLSSSLPQISGEEPLGLDEEISLPEIEEVVLTEHQEKVQTVWRSMAHAINEPVPEKFTSHVTNETKSEIPEAFSEWFGVNKKALSIQTKEKGGIPMHYYAAYLIATKKN